MTLRVEPSGASCGALIHGADLSQPQSPPEIDFIRDAWLKHQVIGICGQELSLQIWSASPQRWGRLAMIPSLRRSQAIRASSKCAAKPMRPRRYLPRRGTPTGAFSSPRQTALCFTAESFHPSEAIRSLPTSTRLTMRCRPMMKAKIAHLRGIHSARRSYSPGGVYGERDKGRSMAIRYSEKAMATQLHPLVRTHS